MEISNAPRPLPSFSVDNILKSWGDFDWQYATRINQLVATMEQISQHTIELGNDFEQLLQNQEGTAQQRLIAQYFHFEWADRIKKLLLLLRDVLLEQQKGQVGLLEQKFDTETLENNWKLSLKSIQAARKELQEIVPKGMATADLQRKATVWYHQQNPWEIYRDQIALLAQQAKELQENYATFEQLKSLFNSIEDLISHSITGCQNELQAVLGKIEALLVIQKEMDDDAHFANDLLHHIESILANYHLHEYNITFKERLKKLVNQYEEPVKLYIKAKGGLIEQRFVSPQKEIMQWLDAEILPLLYEIWEVTENIHTGVKMIIMSMQNRITLQKQEGIDTLAKDIDDIMRPLMGFRSNIKTADKDILDINTLVDERLDNEFKLYPIFDNQRYFLAVSLQSSINQRLWNRQSNWVTKGKQQLDKFWAYGKGIYQRWSYSHHLGVSERIALCLKSRATDPANIHYINIFQTKGYVGDSFFRGRDEQIARVQTLVNCWKDGIRGSVLLTGDRFSGKTVFAEAVAQKFFGTNVLRLSPNTDIEVGGRKHHLTYDLVEALEIVARYAVNHKPMVIIDNLELWWSPKIPLYKNIRGLIEHIDRFSSKIFFVVTTNRGSRNQLFHFSNLERTFQAEINLNFVTKKALHQAIWIRHAATHKQLINKKGEVLSSPKFAKIIQQIYKLSNGNIGEALNIWANATKFVDENQVRNHLEDYLPLPNFLNDDSRLVLETILRCRRTNEYNLRQLFGPAFKTRYATVIRRLLNTGILARQLDGYIEVNHLIVNDLKKILQK
jgi:hypothetical protein